jgi:hypothetical protein
MIGWTMVLGGILVTTACAAELVGVPGSSVQFPTPVERTVGGKQTTLVLTGTALRTKLLFNVYAIGSYLQQGVQVRNAEELAAVDAPKQLHLLMERDVDGPSMADAFKTAVRMNYPEPAFNDEVASLCDAIRAVSLKKHDAIYLTHVPRVGLHVQLVGKAEFTIKNPSFSRAIWDIYLGKVNLGETIKKGLTSRL